MKPARKITVHIEAELLARAQHASGAGVTETVRKGLELLAARDAYQQMSQLRGKVKFSIYLNELRKDRGE